MLPSFANPDQSWMCDVVVVGGSAGGIEALIELLKALPADFPLPILVVQHLSKTMPSRLPEVLHWHTERAVKWAEDGELIQPGMTYVGPANRHLLVKHDRRIGLSDAPPVSWWRPAVDALFHSAVEVYGARVAAIVLSGTMWDGAKGIAAVIKRGGITIAQDEVTSNQFEMPANAIDFGRADMIMSPAKMAEALQALSGPCF